MAKQGYIWPLQIVFLIFFVIGIICLVDPKFFNSQTAVPTGTATTLLLVSVIIAVVLYVPPFVRVFRTCGALWRIDQLVHSSEAQQSVAEARRNLQQLVDRIGNAAVADGGVLRRLAELQAAVNNLDGSIKAALGSSEVAGTIFGDLPLLRQHTIVLGGITTAVADLQTRLTGMAAKLDEVAAKVPAGPGAGS